MEKLNEFLKKYNLKEYLSHDRTYSRNKYALYENDYTSLELNEYLFDNNAYVSIINLKTFSLQDRELMDGFYKCKAFFEDYFKRNDIEECEVKCFTCYAKGEEDKQQQVLRIYVKGVMMGNIINHFLNVF